VTTVANQTLVRKAENRVAYFVRGTLYSTLIYQQLANFQRADSQS
jgi:hypothetical protein